MVSGATVVWLERAAAGDYEPAARELSRLAGQQAGGLRARLHLLAGAYFHAAALVGPAKSAAARQRGDAEFASGLAADPDARLPASAFTPQILELLEQVRRSHAGTGAPQEARR